MATRVSSISWASKFLDIKVGPGRRKGDIMPDASYDAIIIGGGHNGLIAACYLGWAGMKVAVFEKEFELGGGACSEEQPLPAFISNPCASFTRMYSSPAWNDFKLWEKGAWYLTPEVHSAAIFDDGTCLVMHPVTTTPDLKTGETVFWEENLKKNSRNIARFSQRDAEQNELLFEKYRTKWREAVSEYRSSPIPPWGVKDPIERLLDDPNSELDPAWQFMTIKAVACDLFESTELRMQFMRSMQTSTGCFPNDVAPLAETIAQLGVTLGWSPGTVVQGGTHNIAHALQKAVTEMGGTFFVRHPVEKILIENGRAKGVRLADGSEIEATKVVVSGVTHNMTFLDLIGKEHISPDLVRKIENFSYDRGNIHWAWFALHEAPNYKASEFDPDCNRARSALVMPKDLDLYVSKEQAECWTRGYSEKLFMMIGQDTLVDPTRTPKGKHNFLVEQFSAPERFFSEKEWLQIKKDFVEEVAKQWQWYAPNLTKDKIIDAWDNSPYDTVLRNASQPEGSWPVGAMFASQMGRLRPCAELSGNRAPIKDLYLCNATQHYGGGLRGVNGYICYKVIAEDLGLPKIWEEKGRPY
jgi:beta-carotene ketolase (CrtO type)